MQGVAPDATPNRKPDMVWPMTIRWPLAIWDWMFVRDTTFVPDPKQSAQWNRGAYLVEGLGHCGSCHTPRGLFFQEKALSSRGSNGDLYLSGARVENWFASNLRSKCMQRWTEADFAELLQTGKTMNFTALGSMTEVIDHSTQHLKRDDLQAIAMYVKSLKPVASTEAAAKPATASVQRGAALYTQHCAACHQPNGQGVPLAFPGLAANATVQCIDPLNAIRVILAGGATVQTEKSPQSMVMPPFGEVLDDRQIADIVTYIRATWGNSASEVSRDQVKTVRAAIKH
ncbi:gluconate 2-dehydrogenase cytochrome c subunit precursor [mine drainage metagenome]|uniref:Gluconate 2-dehydrogenase cytochrome c subunit n=1 Tax=mine drainage metagenome TaxID=410659 RepID=A0A1J5P6W8_9ZZZZ